MYNLHIFQATISIKIETVLLESINAVYKKKPRQDCQLSCLSLTVENPAEGSRRGVFLCLCYSQMLSEHTTMQSYNRLTNAKAA